ncbi:hypothetical protein, partial [Reichenbachiella sp.]|uniref:hypothetical protein n=1 Tax=Reichenbachiella sp. TaxID=2184521 RepID=UPI003297982A
MISALALNEGGVTLSMRNWLKAVELDAKQKKNKSTDPRNVDVDERICAFAKYELIVWRGKYNTNDQSPV